MQLVQFRCQFSYGNIIGGSEVLIGSIFDFDSEEECGESVMKKHPSATGAKISDYDCYATTGGSISSSHIDRFCLFEGIQKFRLLVLI